MEVKSDEREVDLFTLDEVLMLEVFVSGIYKSVCLRYFGTSLWGLTRKRWLEHEHVWECATALFQSQIQPLVFSTLSAAFRTGTKGMSV